MKYISILFCSLFLIILNAGLLIKLTDEQTECFHLRGEGKSKFLVYRCSWDNLCPCVDSFVVTGAEFHHFICSSFAIKYYHNSVVYFSSI